METGNRASGDDSLSVVCDGRNTTGNFDRFHYLRPESRAAALVAADCDRNYFFYGVARRISISRDPAEFIFPNTEKSVGRIAGRFRHIWFLAHPSRSVSELEVRDTRGDRWMVLRARLDEKRIFASGRTDSCAGGRFLASTVSLSLPNILPNHSGDRTRSRRVEFFLDAAGKECFASGFHGGAHRFSHQDRILRARNRSVHQYAVS